MSLAAEKDMHEQESSHLPKGGRGRPGIGTALKAAGVSAFSLADAMLPHAGWADRNVCRYRFWRANGRLPRAPSDPLATFNDLIFARMAADQWTPLERALIDKQYAKLIAVALCPWVKTVPTRAIVHLTQASDARQAASSLQARAGRAEVAKPTHGSGSVLFLGRSPTPEEIVRFCATAAGSYYESSRESQYRGLERKIIVEDDLSQGQAPPADYKFFCSHGEVLFCQVDVGRFARHRRALVTSDFEPIGVRLSHDLPDVPPVRPANFADMVQAAQRLSRLFPFVRVDLYSAGETVYFGEMTFAPEGGTATLSSEAFGIAVMKRIRRSTAEFEERFHD